MDITATPTLPETMPEELSLLAKAGQEAGSIAMSFFQRDPEVWTKGDSSPVSEADLAVDTYLRETLLKERPDCAWVSEETAVSDERLAMEHAFVVDPIDGTRAFIAGEETWGVSIAFVSGGRPVAAAFICPALGETFLAAAGCGAFLNDHRLIARQDDLNLPVAGPSRMRDAIQALGTDVAGIWPRHIPSLAYRLVMVARGDLRAAFARRNSHDWDIAAADLILAETGCELLEVAENRVASAVSYNSETIRRGVLYSAPHNAADSLLDVAKHMADQPGFGR
ncbi:MAG: 3'(2'),5'-bisphosphate nucleotidase CysQ [Pseudomonadota bacterium]